MPAGRSCFGTWRPATCALRLGGDAGGAGLIAFAANGQTLGVLQHAHCVTLWDLGRGRVLSLGVADSVRTAALAPDGQTFALGRDDGTVPLWTTAPLSPSVALDVPARQGLSLAFAADSATLVSGTIDGTITLWDVSRARPRRVLATLDTPIMALACSPDGKRLAAGCREKTVRVWDAATGHEPAVLRGHEQPVECVAFSPDGRSLASGSRDRTVRIWNTATCREEVVSAGCRALCSRWRSFPMESQWPARTTALLSISGTWLHGGKRSLSLSAGSQVRAVSIAPDGRDLATGLAGGSLKVWDAASGRERLSLAGHRFSPRTLAFFPHGDVLASGSVNGTVASGTW